MIKHLQLTLFLCIATVSLNAQSLQFDWAIQSQSTTYCAGVNHAIDISGSIISTGTFYDTINMNPGGSSSFLYSNGQRDIFIHKRSSNGTFLWAKSIGGPSEDFPYEITTDNNGNVYVAGSYIGSVDFDPGSNTDIHTSSGASAFILKLDANGNYLWSRHISGFGGGANPVIPSSIAIDRDDNILLGGRFSGTADFDPGITTDVRNSSGTASAFVLKLNASGDYTWARTFGCTSFTLLSELRCDTLGNIYSIGNFRSGNNDFDPGSGSLNLPYNGQSDIFIQKLDANGSILWAKSLGGNADDESQSIVIKPNQSIVLAAAFNDTIDANPGIGVQEHISNGNRDAVIISFDHLGSFLWSKSYGGSSNDFPLSIACDLNSSVYITGTFGNTVDFNPSMETFELSSNGSSDLFIQILDSLGEFIYTRSLGNNAPMESAKVIVDNLNNVFLSGYFIGNVDFNIGTNTFFLNSSGNSEAFVLKLNSCSNYFSTDNQSACDSYTWIDGNTYTSTNNTATSRINSLNGCDSIITLNLTVNPSYSYLLSESTCDDFYWDISDSLYTLSGNYTFTLSSIAGCDSTYTLDLVVNQSSFNTYQDTILEGEIYTLPSGIEVSAAGTYNDTIFNSASCDSIITLNLFVDETTSITKVEEINLKVYPTPSTAIINIDADIDIKNINIKNGLGQTVLQAKNKSIVDIKHLQNGIYFLIVNERYIYKIIKR